MNKVFAVSGVVIKEMVRRKDFYVLFVLTVVITALMGSINLFNEDSIVRYVKEICLMLIWISTLVIAVTTTARQIPAERESRTIFPLLAKPITRTQVMLGKFVGCWLAVGIALLVFYTFFSVVSVAREHELPLANYFQALWLHWMMLGIVIAATLAGSLVLTTAANIAIVILIVMGIFLLGEYLNRFAIQAGGLIGWATYAIYYVIPHLELFDVRDRIIHNWQTLSWEAMLLASLYAAAYIGVFLTASALLFRRKPLH